MWLLLWSVGDSYVLISTHVHSLLTNRRPRRVRPWLLRLCLVVLLSTGLSILLGRVLAIHFVPTESMRPTLFRNATVVVNTLNLAPQRGDIVAFRLSDTSSQESGQSKDVFCSRILGLPGDIVEVTDDDVLVNGLPLTEDYLNELNASTSDGWERGQKTVPDNQYYFLGDNRLIGLNSYDHGFLPEENIVGQVVFTVDFPFFPRIVQ